jgi:hypothetical protein
MAMRFVAKDTFKVKLGSEERFEEYWRYMNTTLLVLSVLFMS